MFTESVNYFSIVCKRLTQTQICQGKILHHNMGVKTIFADGFGLTNSVTNTVLFLKALRPLTLRWYHYAGRVLSSVLGVILLRIKTLHQLLTC